MATGGGATATGGLPLSGRGSVGGGAKNSDPVSAYLEDVYTITANLAGLPGLSMPAGFVDGFRGGLQFAAHAQK